MAYHYQQFLQTWVQLVGLMEPVQGYLKIQKYLKK
ncbi:hypothetical protein N561_05025 [Gallibacterium anatis 12656/12]|uniref:Uncharacterized protein n=1 Tax=Gallibacterium anatis 12656/12 TaxID=1195244 RepID=U1GM18_9PAST|nr:hypothetical protein N561_05025 [Gallibacterium anatis 12656/12]